MIASFARDNGETCFHQGDQSDHVRTSICGLLQRKRVHDARGPTRVRAGLHWRNDYGNPPTAHQYLVGYALSDSGAAMLKRVAAENMSRSQTIRRVGDDLIPVLFGQSYWFTAVAYVVALITASVCLVFTLGNIELTARRKATTTP